MSALSDLLSPDAIALNANASGWQDAVRQAGALLERTGVCDPAYTQAMIDSVHDNGPYIVIAPGFAFAHSRPSEAVRRTGLSWLRLADPVEFGHRSNDPVTLVVALAATDSRAHQGAMAELAKLLADPDRKEALERAESADDVLAVLAGADTGSGHRDTTDTRQGSAAGEPAASGRTRNHILTVCGNGVGTSLFLKSTLEKVLNRWGWSPYVTVEATDTVSAKGKAADADLILTSGEIGRALGDLGVPVRIIEDFTSEREVDAALRTSYDV